MVVVDERGLQKRYAPQNRCFGCGPANDEGLRLESRPASEGSERLVCDFVPAPHHIAFGDVLNGGIIGTLLDCHSNWTAAYVFMRRRGLDAPPCTVTADFHVKLRRPTPLVPLRLEAEVISIEGDTAVVEATLEAGGKVTATCRGTFVAVKEGHPAFHRW